MKNILNVSLLLATCAAASLMIAGCKEKESSPGGVGGSQSHTTTPAQPKTDDAEHHDGDGHDHDHDHADGHSHDDGHDHSHDDHDHGDGHDHGPSTALGDASAGPFTVKASRDGDLKSGGDASVNATITTTQGKAAAVRFWIGAEDARGSIKAKGELSDDHWHAHVEVPQTLPDGSKLWVEIENDAGEKHLASFDLKHAA